MHMDKRTITVFAVIGILILGGIGWLMWSASQPTQESPTVNNPPPATGNDDDQETPASSTAKTYTQTGLFTIQYPSDWRVETGDRLGGAFLDMSLVKFLSPTGTFNATGTNFNEAYLVISMEPQSASCESFSDLPNISATSTGTTTINGTTFRTQTTVGAAAGNRYNSQVYRASALGYCGEAVLTVHTGNIDNYPSGTNEFDQNIAFNALENISETLRFTAR